MFDILKDQFKESVLGRDAHDPSVHNDPIAIKTDWKPAKWSGSNFRTTKLVSIDFNRMEFKATIGARLFYLIFISVGFCMLFYFFKEHYPFTNIWARDLFVLPLAGGVFFIMGLFMCFRVERPNVFDKNAGHYYRGKKPQSNSFKQTRPKNVCLLGEIHAIQLISERCNRGKSSYYSYELNLVLRDASRINVIDHGSESWVNKDARTLSEFLNKPIWSAL